MNKNNCVLFIVIVTLVTALVAITIAVVLQIQVKDDYHQMERSELRDSEPENQK